MSSGRKRSISGPAASSIEPNAKKKRYFCTYQKDWESEFKWIKGSDRGPSNAFWGVMSTVEDIFNDRKRFNVLSKLAKALLVLPNSYADCERAFSIVKKMHTEFRSELKNDTLCSLLSKSPLLGICTKC